MQIKRTFISFKVGTVLNRFMFKPVYNSYRIYAADIPCQTNGRTDEGSATIGFVCHVGKDIGRVIASAYRQYGLHGLILLRHFIVERRKSYHIFIRNGDNGAFRIDSCKSVKEMGEQAEVDVGNFDTAAWEPERSFHRHCSRVVDVLQRCWLWV